MKLDIELVQLFESEQVRTAFNQDAQELDSKVAIAYWNMETQRYEVSGPCIQRAPHVHYNDEGVRLPGLFLKCCQ